MGFIQRIVNAAESIQQSEIMLNNSLKHNIQNFFFGFTLDKIVS